MKITALMAFFFLLSFAELALGCSLVLNPVSKFDREEFVFIGKIKGYTDANASKATANNPSFKTYGLVIQIKESVFLPETPPSGQFEVYPIVLFSDCSLGGTKIDGAYGLRETFPVGAEIRVIARRSAIMPDSANKNIIRLEDVPGGSSSVTVNTDEDGRSVASAGTYFDYSNYDVERGRNSHSMHNLPSFEIRKDFYRLHKAASQPERNVILERILGAREPSDIDLLGVLKTYTLREADADRYYEVHMKKFDPEFYDEYMGVKNARLELLRRGYKAEDVKKAMDTAMSESAGFTAEEIVKGSLKYLPPKKQK
jgi:hypothetical protein